MGAGFTLASHDLDIRGAGNLLGEEQSGHIREVGVELYQHMLEEAVAEARGAARTETAEAWAPQINLGMPVLIPESYVADLGVRLSLYRRLGGLVDAAEIEAFAAELVDRFGPLPAEVENLLEVIAIKRLCRAAGHRQGGGGAERLPAVLPPEPLRPAGEAGGLYRPARQRHQPAAGSQAGRPAELG